MYDGRIPSVRLPRPVNKGDLDSSLNSSKPESSKGKVPSIFVLDPERSGSRTTQKLIKPDNMKEFATRFSEKLFWIQNKFSRIEFRICTHQKSFHFFHSNHGGAAFRRTRCPLCLNRQCCDEGVGGSKCSPFLLPRHRTRNLVSLGS